MNKSADSLILLLFVVGFLHARNQFSKGVKPLLGTATLCDSINLNIY